MTSWGHRRRFSQYWAVNPSNSSVKFSPSSRRNVAWGVSLDTVALTPNPLLIHSSPHLFTPRGPVQTGEESSAQKSTPAVNFQTPSTSAPYTIDFAERLKKEYDAYQSPKPVTTSDTEVNRNSNQHRTPNRKTPPKPMFDDLVQQQQDSILEKREVVFRTKEQLEELKERLHFDRQQLEIIHLELKAVSKESKKEVQEFEKEHIMLDTERDSVESDELGRLQAEYRRTAAMTEAIAQERRKLAAERQSMEEKIDAIHEAIAQAGLPLPNNSANA